jgi:hypothetical protein
MRINGGLGRTSRFCKMPPRTFPARFAIRKVCIMKVSHFRDSLQCTKNEGLEKR